MTRVAAGESLSLPVTERRRGLWQSNEVDGRDRTVAKLYSLITKLDTDGVDADGESPSQS